MTVMNAEERERFLATLRRDEDFRAEVRREILTEELLDLPHSIAALVDAVARQRQDFTALAQSVANYMERTISAIGQGFTAVQAEVGTMHAEVGTMHAELGTMHAELGTMRAQMDAGFTSVQAKFDQVDADLQDIRGQLAS
jgi:hypothetical protein